MSIQDNMFFHQKSLKCLIENFSNASVQPNRVVIFEQSWATNSKRFVHLLRPKLHYFFL